MHDPVDATTPLKPSNQALPSRRDTAIDVLRGLCIISMISSHIGGTTLLFMLTHAIPYVSGAEGFVFGSGFVLGMVHPYRVQKVGERAALQRILYRAVQLLLVQAVLAVVVVLVHLMVGNLDGMPKNPAGYSPIRLWLIPMSLPQMVDMIPILPVYYVLLPIAAIMFWLVPRVGWGLCLAGSCVTYLIATLWVMSTPEALRPALTGGAWIPAWQFLFFFGLVAGGNRQSVNMLVSRFDTNRRVAALLLFFGGIIAIFRVSRFMPGGIELNDYLNTFWMSRDSLGAGRVAMTILTAVTGYVVVNWLLKHDTLKRPLLWIGELGSRSLYSYILHILVWAGLLCLSIYDRPPVIRELVLVASIAMVYWCGKRGVLAKVIPN